MEVRIRKSNIADVKFLIQLEFESFPSFQRSKDQTIKRGIRSNFQEVLIVETEDTNSIQIGAAVLYKYSKTLRIYSIAVLPEFQNKGYGDYLLKHIFALAYREHYTKIAIEVNAQNTKLIDWYKSKGFNLTEKMDNYYEQGVDAVKMELKTGSIASIGKTVNIIVINQPFKWTFTDLNAKIISVKEYINNPIYHTSANFRVFNLCSSYKYQSFGYYVSLLASARGQHVIPNIATILDFRLLNVIHSVTYDIEEFINKSLNKESENSFSFNIYFGQTNAKGYSALAMKLYQLFETPLFKVEFIK